LGCGFHAGDGIARPAARLLGSFRLLLLKGATESSLLPGLPGCPGAWLATAKPCWEPWGPAAPLGQPRPSFPFLCFPHPFNVHVVAFEHMKVLGSSL